MNDSSAPSLREAATALQAFALSLPEAYEEFPWGERVVKVNKKIFVFFGLDAEIDSRLSLGLKLPQSGDDVLALPFAQPARYNLGKSGWISMRFEPDDQLALDMIERWILESYRAVAPKRLAARLGEREQAT